MARQCCRDSVAMKVIAHGETAETEGTIVCCRWCSGYARYVQGRWQYAEDEPIGQRMSTQADLIDHPVRKARIAEVLGKKIS